MLNIKKLFSIILTLCITLATISTALAATTASQSEQLKAAVKAVQQTKDSSHIYNVIDGVTVYNDMTAEEFLGLVKKYIIPEGNETVPTFYRESDYRISNATAEKDGFVDGNVNFVCGNYTQHEGIRIKIPKLTGAAAVKSEDRVKIEADRFAINAYLKTVKVTNDTTKEKLLEGIKSAVSNGTVVSWADDFNKREATQQWAGFIKGTINLTLNSEKDSVKFNKAIQNILPGVVQEEVIPISEKNVEYENAGFTDVSKDAYYSKAVDWAVAKNITAGTSSNSFSPDDTCTRAQILTFLWRASGSPKPTSQNSFTDVSETDYYYDAAIWASEKGMVTGTMFEGDTPCTRSATVMYLWQNVGSPKVGLKQMFSDVPITKNYATAVCWAVNSRITSGTSETTFSPDEICSRGQIVTFLFRAV